MITILSYCNTVEKKKQLQNLILSIKGKKPNEEILVYSHYQDLEPEWWRGSNYYIYDFTNPKSNKIFFDWVIITAQNKKFYRCGDDWGFAVLQMIKRASLFLLNIGVSKTTIINYDVDPSCVDEINFPDLQENEIGAFCPWGDDPSRCNLTYMHLDLSKIGKQFFESITWEKYHSFESSKIPESIFYDLITQNFEFNWKKIQSLKLTLSEANRHLEEGHPLSKYCTTILASRNNFQGNHHKCLSIWNCKMKISQIEVEISGTKFKLFNEVQGDNSCKSFFSHLPGGITIDKITILQINDDTITPYEMDGLNEDYWNKNFHEPHF